MKNNTQSKHSLISKCLLSFFSLIFFLTLLEIGLWYIGQKFYTPDNDYRTAHYENIKSRVKGQSHQKIVCVGDSYTHGGFVESNETFPAALHFHIQNQHPESRIAVLNKGICESNTRELLDALPQIIQETSPEIILLLVGSANRFNPWDYEKYAKNNLITSIKSRFFNLRVVKMFRFIQLSLFLKKESAQKSFLKRNTFLRQLMPQRNPFTYHDAHLAYLTQFKAYSSLVSDPLTRAWALYNGKHIPEAIELIHQNIKNTMPNRLDYKFALLEFHFALNQFKKTDTILKSLNLQYPHSEKVHNALTYYYFELCLKYKEQMNFPKAIEYCLKAIEQDPSADYFYYELNRVYGVQSFYTSEMIYQELNQMEEKNSLLKMNNLFSFHKKIYNNKIQWDSGIAQWIHNDLEQIIKLCQEQKIQLIFQNYPIDHKIANQALTKLAQKYNIPLVDHLQVFQTLKPKKDYIYDDDHCTPQGHQIMAENAYKILMENKLLDIKP